MTETGNFYNDGFGWVCRACSERETASAERNNAAKRSRLLSEGEAESKTPRLSNTALARWADRSRTTLVCPRCASTEAVKSE